MGKAFEESSGALRALNLPFPWLEGRKRLDSMHHILDVAEKAERNSASHLTKAANFGTDIDNVTECVSLKWNRGPL